MACANLVKRRGRFLAHLVRGDLTIEQAAAWLAISVHCDGCIAFHVHDALKAGATAAEVEETIGVAILVGGGPSLMYGTEAFEVLEQLQAAEAA